MLDIVNFPCWVQVFFISIHFIELAVTFRLLGSSLIPLGLVFEIFFFRWDQIHAQSRLVSHY